MKKFSFLFSLLIVSLIIFSLFTFQFTSVYAQESEIIYVAFIWNQHQPLYKDNLTGQYRLPWVRFHAAKDYYQMAAILEKYPLVHQTFNLTPSLLVQILDYTEGSEDYYQIISYKKSSQLEMHEKKFIEDNFFQCTIPWREKVNPQFENYKRLRLKIGEKEKLTDQDYLDIVCFYNLAWIDPEIIEKDEKLLKIYNKGGDFTDSDRLYILKVQKDIIEKVIPVHKRLQDKGQIEIISTPFYHPILPLLIDTDFAKRCNEFISMPAARFSYPEDATVQVEKAVKLNEELFGSHLSGLWPSEQAVCPEMIPILAEAGINWIVTDEVMLEKSLGIDLRDEKNNLIHPEILYKPYQVVYNGKKVYAVFRDKEISDRMCVQYGQMDGKGAAQDLLKRIKDASGSLKKNKGPHLITIALDGENAWENYPDDKRTFLNEFYRLVSGEKSIKLVTVKEYLNKFSPEEKIENFATGSWNNSSLERWIGSPAKNKAWDLLAMTRKDLTLALLKNKYSSFEIDKAKESLYMAEGSDWCWWFDSMPYSQSKQFDELLRLHLKNVYKALNLSVPNVLDSPILDEFVKAPEIKAAGKAVFFLNDDPEDELIKGLYKYPTDGSFYPYKDYFELKKYEIFDEGEKYIFRITVGKIYNIWNAPLGFSHQLVNIYISTGSDSGKTASFKPGPNITFDPSHPWNFYIRACGWKENCLLYRLNGNSNNMTLQNLSKYLEVTSDAKDNTITIAVDKGAFPKSGIQWHYVILAAYESTAGYDFYRLVNPKVSGWFFGGGKTNSPFILDYLSPQGRDEFKMLTDYEAKEAGRSIVLYPVEVKL